MDIFDIIGPVMVGPSSSHTAGAVRIGYIAGKLMGEPIAKAEILLYGSFLATGKGHGTRKALVAGLLGMKPDDMRIPDSFEIAKEHGIEVAFGESALRDAHPNTAQIFLTSVTGKNLEVVGESLGGSRINIAQIDGISTNFQVIIRHLLCITWISLDMLQKLHQCLHTNQLILLPCSCTGLAEAAIQLWCLSVTRKCQRRELTG